ncbi:MAG: response regulator [Candidatus Melainabacteria bacterium]|nr:response regulator [Candidatus Melainabacteria bacterium]
MANEWNTHLESLKDRLSELNQTIDVIKNKVEKRPGLDAATQGIAGLISSNSDKSLAQYPVILSNVLSDSAIGAIMLNSEGKFMMFNFTAQRILGIAYVSRMCGAGDSERQEEPVSFLKSDDSYFEERELPWKRVLDGVEVNNFRLKVKKDAINDVRWINISATPFIDASQAVSGGIVFLIDFTDEVNLETSINSLCGVIAGQISQVGNSQRELEQLANQLAQTGIQKILLEKGINSPEARAPEPVAVSPVPDLSQRARFQPETAREAVEDRKKSEETPDGLIEKMADVAHEPEQARAQESQNQAPEITAAANTENDDSAPWPDEADAEDFNRPLWEEYGKGEEESAQSWTKSLDAVVSEVIQQESTTSSVHDTDNFDDDEDDNLEDEDEDEDENEVNSHEEIEVFHHEDNEVTDITDVEDIEDAEEIAEVSEIEEIQEIAEVEQVEEAQEVQEVEQVEQVEEVEEVHEVESIDSFESIHEPDAGEEFAHQEEFSESAESFDELEQIEEQEQEQEVEGFPEMETIEEAIGVAEAETAPESESAPKQTTESEFDEFEPIDEILSFDEKPQSFEPGGMFEAEQYVQPESYPETQVENQAPPPPAPLPAPEIPALMQEAMQAQEAPPQNEDFSNIGSLVQKPSLKDTLLGGKKKRNTSASMHRIKALSGATELGEDEEQNEQAVVDYGSEDADSDLNIKKVLVVDDIPVNQKLLLLHLRRLGYDADVASNGQEALDALANKEYELILMDCDMPVMNGFEAAARIRSNESYSHRRIPIIALTSYDREGDRERCIAAGMDDYITKGASRKELKEAIKRSVVSAREKGQAQSGEFNLDDIQADIAPLDIKAMLKLYGKEEVEEISRLFLSNMGTYIECMQLAIDEKDADSVVHFANAVKGPCAALGMKLMTRLTTDIISYSEAKDWTQVRVKYMRLKAVFVQTREELKKVCPDDSLLAK